MTANEMFRELGFKKFEVTETDLWYARTNENGQRRICFDFADESVCAADGESLLVDVMKFEEIRAAAKLLEEMEDKK